MEEIKKCQWCNNDILGRTIVFCGECLQKMRETVIKGESRIMKPTSQQRCIMCGEYENRIIYFYKEKNNEKDGVYICDICVDEEMAKEEKQWRIR